LTVIQEIYSILKPENMKTFNYVILSITVLFFIIASCKKENTDNPSNNSTVYLEQMLKNYQSAATNDALLVAFHQHTGTGNHDSCYYYWQQFRNYDSLFSFNFYDYCRAVYANNGGHNYGEDDWNWDNDHEGMHHEDWQCGLDTLEFEHWDGYGDCWEHDSTMHQYMQRYGMTGYFSDQANQCYSDMQDLRYKHFHQHNYHWN